MSPEELRNKLMSRIDALLGRTLLVWGEDRQLLSALRSYVSTMTDADLTRLQSFLTHNAEEGK